MLKRNAWPSRLFRLSNNAVKRKPGAKKRLDAKSRDPIIVAVKVKAKGTTKVKVHKAVGADKVVIAVVDLDKAKVSTAKVSTAKVNAPAKVVAHKVQVQAVVEAVEVAVVDVAMIAAAHLVVAVARVAAAVVAVVAMVAIADL